MSDHVCLSWPCKSKAHRAVWVCRACHFGHFNECEDERCQSMRLEDRHE